MSYAGALEIMLVEGKGLKSRDFLAHRSPYVKFLIDGEIAKSKVSKHGGETPNWSETLTMNVIAGQHVLKLELFDAEVIHDHKEGEADISLDAAFQNGTSDQWVTLRHSDGHACGELHVVLYFKSHHIEHNEEYPEGHPNHRKHHHG